MSHVVEIRTEVRDAAAVRAACGRLSLAAPVEGPHALFNGEARGLGVRLPGWRYPVVCDVASGQVRFDDYGGRWGERTQLDRFLQAYAVEKAKRRGIKQIPGELAPFMEKPSFARRRAKR